MSQEKFFLKIPKKPEYVTLVRLMTSGIGSNLDLDIDAIEDLAIIVTECCNIAIALEREEDTLSVELTTYDDKLSIKVSGIDEAQIEEKEELEITSLIISTLSDDVKYGDSYILVNKYF